MKTDNGNTIDLTSHIEDIERGEGFYATLVAEKQRISRPARKRINGLRELFVLLYDPVEKQQSDSALSRLSQLIKRVLLVYENAHPKEFLRKLRKRLFKICDKLRGSQSKDLPLPEVMQEDVMDITQQDVDLPLDDTQKELIYNMLLSNGVTHEEAINELSKY
ncbi:MAG: hypothetical protein IKK64_06330 [Bacteroidales bacterium]|nr:hypothetical protein [Bacteroidales bacterium]